MIWLSKLIAARVLANEATATYSLAAAAQAIFPNMRPTFIPIPQILVALATVFCVLASSAGSQSLSDLKDRGNMRPPDEPLQAEVGIEINQITGVDQKAENFGAVVTLRIKWQDPLLGFDEVKEERDFLIMSIGSLLDRANEVGTLAPSLMIKNQQGNLWVNEAFAVVQADGTAAVFEQSTLTLQAPLFNFTRYPFDRQKFYVEVVSNLPLEYIEFVAMEEDWGLSDMLGEEEWILENASMEVSTDKGLTGIESSSIALVFEGRRHLQYYVTRIFVPMLVLIVVSWATFFLDEYRRRIEIAGSNLLVFVGFNWIISDSLPKLGYLTFLDAILQFMFVVTGGVIVVNVALRRIKQSGREDLARQIDNYVIKWIYPLGYLGAVLLAIYIFLYRG
jgi:hypothetical protein